MAQNSNGRRSWIRWIGLVIGRLGIWGATALVCERLLDEGNPGYAMLVVLLAIATEVMAIQRRRAAAQARLLRSRLRLTTLPGSTKSKFRSAFEPSERVDFDLVKRAIEQSDEGDFESAVELMTDNSVADAVKLDHIALYVRGFAHFNLGYRARAKEDLENSLACLDSERGVVESAIAALYIDGRQWKDGLAAVERSIEGLGQSTRARRWVPYAYKAAIYEMNNDVKAAEKVLVEMAPSIRHDQNARYFLEHHPFLQETVKSSSFKDAFKLTA